MTGAPLRVGVLGAGTVGREVVGAFLDGDRAARLAPADGRPLRLAGVAVRDVDRARSAGLPDALLTDAPAHLVASPDVDVIVEVMGGLEPARTLLLGALSGGKAVVTANKALLATHGPELEAAARGSGAPLRFEASVGGGIPVLSPLAADLAANRVTSLRGILNGTTNAILTAMAREGTAYADALAEAQAMGYAEADPTADVEGHDAAAKLVILLRLAFGAWVDPTAIPRRPAVRDSASLGAPGITGVTAEDVAAATDHGRVLKLVASGRRREDGSLEAGVLPTAVFGATALGSTDGVQNRIEIEAEPVGSVAFAGPGAGGGATSSAVLGDLVAIARGGASTWAGLPAAVGRWDGGVSAPAGPALAAPSGACYPLAE
jgi:homoserine dehydrogenase